MAEALGFLEGFSMTQKAIKICSLFFLIFLTGILGCEPEFVKEAKELGIEPQMMYRLQGAKRNLIYFQDHDVEICFAFTWVGDGQGGPALATVDCAVVQHKLVGR